MNLFRSIFTKYVTEHKTKYILTLCYQRWSATVTANNYCTFAEAGKSQACSPGNFLSIRFSGFLFM